MGFTTAVKNFANIFLNPLGIELKSLTDERIEGARLKELLDKGHWNHARFTKGLELNPEAYKTFFNEITEPHQDALRSLPKTADESTDGFFLDTEWFGLVDAAAYYGIARHAKPRHVLEIGSGFSTRLMRRAVKEGNLKTKIICVDPQPRAEIKAVADEWIQARGETLTADKITGLLQPGDFLFIDSSHLVNTGNDVVFLFLEVLPQLPEEVWIHVHDIFLPYEYPTDWVIDKRWGWNEQYLLHAFLIDNKNYEIKWPSWYMWNDFKDDLIPLLPNDYNLGPNPTSFWMRKVKN